MAGMAPEEDRLDSWKQIAAYLNKSERTVRRWHESESLPVHKHPHQQRGSVWAYRKEVDEWIAARVIRSEPVTATGAPRKRPYAWLLGAVSIAVASFLLVRLGTRPQQTVDPIPLTTLPGAEYGASFSPDAKRFVFHWTAADSSRRGLYIKRIDDDNITPLAVASDPRSSYNYSPAWSPDGRTIAFLRRTPESETWLVLIDAAGGSERTLLRTSVASNLFFGSHQHVSWSPDSKSLFVPMALNEKASGVYRVSTTTGEATPIVTGFAAHAPAVSPDGRRLAALRIEGMPHNFQELLLYDLDATGSVQGSPISLYKGYSVSSGLAWMPDSRTLLFCNSGAALVGPLDSRLYRLPALAGAHLTPIGGIGCSTVSVSRQGLIAYGDSSRTRSKMLHRRFSSEMLHRRLSSDTPVEEFASSSRYDNYPSFSPAGSMLAYYSTRSGKSGIWTARSDGTGQRCIFDDVMIRSGPAWSPDGQRLVYILGRSLAISSINTAAPPTIISTGDAGPQHPVWSADGRSIYYNIEHQLWRVLTDGTGRHAIGDSGPILSLAASTDGKALYYARLGQSLTLCRRSIDATSEEIMEEGLAMASIAVTRRFLYFVRADMNLYALPLAGGPVEKIGSMSKFLANGTDKYHAQFTVSQDDSAIICTLIESQEVDLELLRP
jgi:Tol biopolymer transport system component